MEPLMGWTVAVTADRRAAEQAAMLERRGANVLRGAVLDASIVGDEPGLASATQALIEAPPSTIVVNTSFGVRSWFAWAHAAGLGAELADVLGEARVVARGPKAAGAAVAEGLAVAWRARGETMDEVVEMLTNEELAGQRIAFLEHGAPSPDAVARLERAGAEVTSVPVYRWGAPTPAAPAGKLAGSIIGGDVDAVTFTSAPAVEQLVSLHPEAMAELAEGDVVVACVGPVTAAAARAHGITDLLCASPSRLGPMVKALSDHFAGRSRTFYLDRAHVVVQGAAIAVDGVVRPLGPKEQALLHLLLDAGGAVLSKALIAQRCYAGSVDEHAVEVAVNRLRRKLGRGASALQTSNRRGYRLEVTSEPGPLLTYAG